MTLCIRSILAGFIKQNPLLFVIYSLSIMAMPISDVVLPHYYGKIISGLHEKSPVYQFILPVILLLFLVQTLYFINDYLEIHLYPKMHTYIREYCFNYIIQGITNNPQDLESGKIIAKLIRFAPLLYNFMDSWKEDLIPYILMYTIAVGYLATIDWLLSAMIAFVTLCIVVLTFKSMFACSAISRTREKYYNQIYEEIDDMLRNIVPVLNMNNYEHENNRLRSLENGYKVYGKSALKCSMLYKFTFLVIFMATIYFFVKRCMLLYNQQKIGNAVLVSIFIIMLFIFNTVVKHTSEFKDLLFRYGTLQDALQYFDSFGGGLTSQTKTTANPIQTTDCIILKDIQYEYGPKGHQEPVIRDINIRIGCGKNVAIVGPIGGGKSTILKLLMKYVAPTSGEIYINGLPYSNLSDAFVRERVGYIQQSSILFNRPLMANIRYGSSKATDEDVHNLISRLELQDHFKRFPDGLNTMAGKNGSRLSGGERQIIVILRVLLQNPPIILLDEPTSAMDESTKNVLMSLLMHILEEKTVLCVTHDNNILNHFDDVYEIIDGTIRLMQ